ncbi:hypothetical protein AKJ09_07768 [Labilithrix luteola]|uniref:Type IV fimbrial biogenesis protein PilY1 n=1 Tax=Labilithrix luteola TaxID=1391654 RepID=A0A0K1Q6S1_9BACT|nr:hypothetical protein [Labilithrix luteola]AKV01105.1 hypothetical protein AKJ09_07768 [Labilithrix luteola]
MKLSLRRAGGLALSVGLLAGIATAACANSEDLATGSEEDASTGNTVLDGSVGDAQVPSDDAADDAEPPVRDGGGPKKCSDQGFCHTPVSADQTIEALWGDGAGVVWAGTTKGDLLRWDGNAWNVHASNLGAIHAIWGSSPTDVWVGGDNGISHGTGANAASLTFAQDALPGEPVRIDSIWGATAHDIWAVGATSDPNSRKSFGRVFHLGEGGNDAGTGSAWTLDPISSNGVTYTRVWGNASGAVWAGGGRPIEETPWISDVVVVGKSGAGEFVEYTLPFDPDPDKMDQEKVMLLTGAIFTSDTTMTIYGQPRDGSTRASSWRGTSADGGKTFTFTWVLDDRAPSPAINTVIGNGANDVWAAGDYGRLIHWNGTAWATMAISVTGLPVTDPFKSIWVHGASDIWIGGKGMALRFDPTQVKAGGAK